MKAVIFIFLTLSAFTIRAQQQIRLGGNTESTTIQQGIPNNSVVPLLKFKGLLNAPNPIVSLNDLKDKIVILEFWATWCGPCIPAMAHLDSIQKKYPTQVQVIAISDDSPERLERFIKNKASALWFLSDPEYSFQTYFPFKAIPHTVLIDKTGKLIANTSPNEISESIIEQLLKGETVKVQEKKDSLTNFNMSKDYFPKDPNKDAFIFDIQPPIQGGFSMTKRYANGPWKDRRITAINKDIAGIFRMIYDKPSTRIIYEGVSFEKDFNTRNQAASYCIDAVVPKGKEDQLYTFMQSEIEKLDLPYKTRLEKRELDCYIVKCINPEALNAFKLSETKEEQNTPKNRSLVIKATDYTGSNVPISALCKHFESFRILNGPVIDETKIIEKFNLTFKFDAENPESFKEELSRLGLKVEREKREVEVLIIYKN